jgi:hypothetical protein
MSKKKTAVEWFVEQLEQNGIDIGNGIKMAYPIPNDIYKEAKAMEKIQMINTWITSEQWSDGKFTNAIKAFKEYYKETYES